MLQKHIKGWLIYKLFNDQIKKCQIDANMKHFNDMRKRLILNSQILLAYSWRRYVKRRAQQKITEKLLANEQKRE